MASACSLADQYTRNFDASFSSYATGYGTLDECMQQCANGSWPGCIGEHDRARQWTGSPGLVRSMTQRLQGVRGCMSIPTVGATTSVDLSWVDPVGPHSAPPHGAGKAPAPAHAPRRAAKDGDMDVDVSSAGGDVDVCF